jgi:hypothetical protein
VENAVKFSNTKNGKIAINLFNLADLIIYEVENYVNEESYQAFREKAEKLLDGADIETKYFAALQQKGENPSGSGLGLLTILHDFGARVGVRFIREDGGLYRVSLQVHMRPEEVLA